MDSDEVMDTAAKDLFLGSGVSPWTDGEGESLMAAVILPYASPKLSNVRQRLPGLDS